MPANTASRTIRRFSRSKACRRPAPNACSITADHPELDDTDRLVVEYAIAAWERPNRIPEALFDRLRAHFSEAQIVELTLRITLCGFFNKFNDALQIEEEPEAVASLAAASPVPPLLDPVIRSRHGGPP